MDFEKSMKKLLQEKNKLGKKQKIVFVEGWSNRMQSAIANLVKDDLIEPLLIFETEQQFNDLPTKHSHLIIENEKELIEKFSQTYFEKRKGKETIEDINKNMHQSPLFSAMLVETGMCDGCVGGIHNPTANILRAAFKAIGPIEGIKTISSIMIMHKNEKWFIFTDISVNPKPSQDQLIDIAKNASDFGNVINFDKKVAFLSYSTSGSAITDDTQIIRNAAIEYNKKFNPDYQAIGEIQFDAAFDLDIRKKKYNYKDNYDEMPTIFVFPDLNSGNIGYKIAQRLAGFGAIGPIITGLKKPMNDLSRGSTVDDVYNTTIITALQAFGK